MRQPTQELPDGLYVSPLPAGVIARPLGAQATCAVQAAPVAFYWTVVFSCPGEETVIVPPQEHTHCDESSSAGTSPIVTFAEPGVHAPTITGMQGCGESTPCAAAVAAAT